MPAAISKLVNYKIFSSLFFLLAGLYGVVGCGEKNVYAPPPTPKVTVTQPTHRLVTDYLEFTGNAQAIQTAMLRARVQGILERVYFKDGDLVKKGQLLFLIQPNTYEAQLESAEAEVMRQKAALNHAKTEFARYTNLVQQKAAAATDLENWRFQMQSSQGALKAAQAQVELARLNLSYTRVTAPFNGRIDRRLQDPGNLVGAGEFTPLAEINQIDPIYVYFTISESDLLRVMGKSGRFSFRNRENQGAAVSRTGGRRGLSSSGLFGFRRHQHGPNYGHFADARHFPESERQNHPGDVCPPPGRYCRQAQRRPFSAGRGPGL